MMTRKDFVAAAKRLAQIEHGRLEAVQAFIEIAKQSNPRFDAQRFITAVQVERTRFLRGGDR